ncbi:MAG: DUF2065 domain-containing protein [Rhodospirillaceae bacterium]|jgi:hypothetical protein|nr:DUF2065 domain-containing protein [Rhodospirillaceae bacterium]MBT4045483.1 DUF2065 domain-containing protein [Rhodospirillaceae bacterium]MBT4689084.1 DUF2065 domain-containing protein [Rhodospirillaceae bacterium]MBT5082091.1 DUF2065 domain-containing protein [Rhodospirillaceae bacterium]MBT5523564.1 DUF2065 domain-containing protein [Rhodospirillaceae bacterium]
MLDLLMVLGLFLALEGGLYAAFPAGMKRMMAIMIQQPDDALRMSGLGVATFGVGLVWVVKTFL